MGIRQIDFSDLQSGDILCKLNDHTLQGKMICKGSALGGQHGNIQHIAIFTSQDGDGTVIDAHLEEGVQERTDFKYSDFLESDNMWWAFRPNPAGRFKDAEPADQIVDRARTQIGKKYGKKGMWLAVQAPFRHLFKRKHRPVADDKKSLLTDSDQHANKGATFCSDFAAYAIWNEPRTDSLCYSPNEVVRRMTNGKTTPAEFADDERDDSQTDFICLGMVI